MQSWGPTPLLMPACPACPPGLPRLPQKTGVGLHHGLVVQNVLGIRAGQARRLERYVDIRAWTTGPQQQLCYLRKLDVNLTLQSLKSHCQEKPHGDSQAENITIWTQHYALWATLSNHQLRCHWARNQQGFTDLKAHHFLKLQVVNEQQEQHLPFGDRGNEFEADGDGWPPVSTRGQGRCGSGGQRSLAWVPGAVLGRGKPEPPPLARGPVFHHLSELAGVVVQITVVWRPLGFRRAHFGAAQILKHRYLCASLLEDCILAAKESKNFSKLKNYSKEHFSLTKKKAGCLSFS